MCSAGWLIIRDARLGPQALRIEEDETAPTSPGDRPAILEVADHSPGHLPSGSSQIGQFRPREERPVGKVSRLRIMGGLRVVRRTPARNSPSHGFRATNKELVPPHRRPAERPLRRRMSYRSRVDTVVRPRAGSQATSRRLWLPRQHGAWAMLAVPLLLGIAVTRPNLWHAVLGAAAIAGYLASATAQTWVRARVRQRYTASLIAYVVVATALGMALVVTHPGLVLAVIVLVPAGMITLVAAKLGRGRGVAAGFAQVVEAFVLVPAAASLTGPVDSLAVSKATLLAAVYLVGTLLAVRSVIREQGNASFAAVSVGFHLAATVVGAILLPLPFVVLLGLLAMRSVLLPLVQRRCRETVTPLRPVHVGMVEMVVATCVVGLAFVSPI